MRFKLKTTFIALVAVGFCLHSCKHDIQAPTGAEGSCHPDSVYFQNDIFPLITGNCATIGCHDARSAEEGVVLESYQQIARYVRDGNAKQSKLYKVLNDWGEDRMPPPPQSAFSKQQKQMIFDWIEQGALENQCASSCDTTVFTYSGAVEVFLSTTCVGCHNANNKQGNVLLNSYSEVKKVANSGKLLDCLTGSNGRVFMPPSPSLPLEDCKIRVIAKWIENGANND